MTTATVTFKHLDLSYLETLIGDDNETKMIILSTLLEEVPQEVALLEQFLAQEDWKAFHEVSHKLKSTLAYVGNIPIFDANQSMMMCARNMENLDSIPLSLTIVKEKWEMIEPEVLAALEELSA
jgi:HPt (histidine-containing phosphotransfer) domain-containing protein